MTPKHYEGHNGSNLTCLDAMKAALTTEEFIGFCKGCVFKYVWRERNKGGADDLAKARDYLNILLEGMDEQ